MTDLSRRSFLKGAAFTAAGGALAGTGIIGCTPDTPPAVDPAPTPGTPAALDEATVIRQAAAKLNPQDNSIVGTTSDFKTLFTPLKIGSMELKTRIVKSAAGSPTPRNEAEIIDYYGRFAKGGVDLVWVEDVGNGKYTHFESLPGGPFSNAPLKQIVDAVHAQGSYVGYQMSCMFIRFSGSKPAAGMFDCAVAGDMSPEEVAWFIEDTIAAVKMLKEIGFDAVEINAAGNNIGQSFFSRMRNQRTDQYGPQNFENRSRFVCEMIQGIKRECGADFPVQVLINGIEENDQTLGDNSLMTTVEENIEMAKYLEAAGADSLHVRLGPIGQHVCQFASDLYFSGYGVDGTTSYGTQFDFSRHWGGKLISEYSGCGMMLDVAKEFKTAVKIPVGTVTYMDPAHAPAFFEAALADGKADFLLMNRPLTVDYDYINKLKAGKLDEIAPCTRCMHCFMDFGDRGIYKHCRVNATSSRAFWPEMPEGVDLIPAATAKNVMVIGGGPAGMEAARVAAQRGHKVTLYEKKGALGGLLDFAHLVKGPHENLDALRAYMAHQLDLVGVKVELNTEVTADFVKQQAPDVVVVATGGLRDKLALSATAGTQVLSMNDFMAAEVGNDVVLVGSNAQSVDVAMYLMAQGKTVTIVTPDPTSLLGKGQSSYVKTFTQAAMYARGLRVFPGAKIASVADGSVVVATESGAKITVPCSAVIEAMDMLPDTSISDALAGMEVYAAGDCKRPWNIAEAVHDAHLAARAM